MAINEWSKLLALVLGVCLAFLTQQVYFLRGGGATRSNVQAFPSYHDQEWGARILEIQRELLDINKNRTLSVDPFSVSYCKTGIDLLII